MSPHPAKIQSITKWLTPATWNELQQFLGFTNFYRRFISDYSKVAAPLTELTSTHLPFSWTERPKAAFSRLKRLFTSASMLANPDPAQQVVVEMDASDTGVGAVFS